MAKLHYTAICSLDGYIEDESGSFDWSVPDAEVHQFANDLERGIGTHLYGRRLYDVMAWWETIDTTNEPDEIKDYAKVWRAADKIVYSRTLEHAASHRTRIERTFDVEEVRQLKGTLERDMSIGGPELAAQAIKAGLVDEIHLLVSPVIVGGGKPALPAGVKLDLELKGERRFGNGVVYLHYRVKP